MLKRAKSLLYDQQGEIVVESALIMPFVMLIVCSLIFVGLYQLQRVLIYSHAQKYAVHCSRMLMQPGYEKLGTRTSNSIDFDDISIKKGSIISKPYRYWFVELDERAKMENELRKLVNSVTFVRFISPEISIKAENKILYQQIVVDVKMTINTPEFFKILKLPSKFEDNIQAVAVVCDPPEFIRNTDLAYDLTKQLFDYLGDKQSVKTMIQRVKDLRNRYF